MSKNIKPAAHTASTVFQLEEFDQAYCTKIIGKDFKIIHHNNEVIIFSTSFKIHYLLHYLANDH